MPFRIFQYPLPAPDEPEDLNVYLAANRVASITHHLANHGGNSILVFVVETATSSIRTTPASTSSQRIDYKESLTPEQFAIFSRLRDERKKLANAEGVPVYSVFTNAQLAEMVEQRVTSDAGLRAIGGIGEARVKKYGETIISILREWGIKEGAGG